MSSKPSCLTCSCKFSEGCKAERQAKERAESPEPIKRKYTQRRQGFYGNRKAIMEAVKAKHV